MSYTRGVRGVVLLAIIGCAAPAPPAPGPAVDAPAVTDVRVAIPAPDPSFVDLISPELTIAPGHEAIYCYYAPNPIGHFGADRVEPMQGAGGHHIAFRYATVHRPDGAFEDCTNDQDARQLGDLFLGLALPPGWAAEIPADAQLVLEMHYQNAGELPLLARDVIRIHRLPDDQITRWIHMMHLAIFDLVVGLAPTTRAFDCTVPDDVALYQFWGHQHGLGKRESVSITPPDGATRTLYDATWGIDPLVRGSDTTPVVLARGTRLHVICEWNPSEHELRFPDEMCAFGGYVEGPEVACKPPSYTP